MINTAIFDNAYDLIGTIVVLFFLFTALIGLFVVGLIYYVSQSKQEKEFIDTLDEHDRSVVLNYKISKQVIFKKKLNIKK